MLDYRKLTLSQIVEDLNETFSDLVFNAGQKKFEPFLDAIENLDVESDRQPNERLVAIMTELLVYDRDQLHAKAFELFGKAVEEVEKIVRA